MDAEVIYMRLLDEGTDAWRPVSARPVRPGVYRVLDHEAEGESWEFAPGELVRVGRQTFSDGRTALTAVSREPA